MFFAIMFKKKPTVSATPHINPSLSTPLDQHLNTHTQLDRSKTFRRCDHQTVAKSPIKSSATTRSRSPQHPHRNPATTRPPRTQHNPPSHPSAMPSSPKTAYRHASQPPPALTCAKSKAQSTSAHTMTARNASSGSRSTKDPARRNVYTPPSIRCGITRTSCRCFTRRSLLCGNYALVRI